MKYILETERLRLREFILDDADFIVELHNSPGWLKFIGDRNVRTKAQAIDYLENGPIKSYVMNGYGLSLVEMKADGKSIGMCGILKRDHLEHPDLGFAFLPEYGGSGYAYEITVATVKYASEELNIGKLAAITVAENANSIKLLQKLGFMFKKDFSFPGSNEELRLYEN